MQRDEESREMRPLAGFPRTSRICGMVPIVGSAVSRHAVPEAVRTIIAAWAAASALPSFEAAAPVQVRCRTGAAAPDRRRPIIL
jgi:hypothetical protein